MRLLATFSILILLPLLALSMTPVSLCEKPVEFAQWPDSLQDQFNEVCASAGVYEDSALPDKAATTRGKFREGTTALYDYKDFVGTLSKSLDAVNRQEICDPSEKAKPLPYPSVNLEKTATGNIPVSVVSEEELNQIFAEFANDPQYAWEVPEEGCWARALMMTRALEKRGIRAGKMFAEGPFRVPSPDEQSPDKRWAYHVAPMVAVKTAKGIEMRMIDPSLFDKPVAAKKWGDRLFSLAEETESARIYITDRFSTEPLLDRPLESIMTDPSKGRWHKAEVVLAEQELRRLQEEALDKKAMSEFLNEEFEGATGE